MVKNQIKMKNQDLNLQIYSQQSKNVFSKIDIKYLFLDQNERKIKTKSINKIHS